MSKQFYKIQIVLTVCVLISVFGFVSSSSATSKHLVPMKNIGLGTYYVNVMLADMPDSQFMVDTGSGYTTINEKSLSVLQEKNRVRYVKDIRGVLANGNVHVVEVWEVSSITLNQQCTLHNIEVAVFPGKTRQILGMNALKKAGPLELSFEPPSLSLGHCDKVS